MNNYLTACVPQKLDKRTKLWDDIIESSDVDVKTKAWIKNILEEFKTKKNNYNSIWDAIYSTIKRILYVVDSWEKSEDKQALFESLRDDLWSLKKEIEE